jgi:hypothetical protein
MKVSVPFKLDKANQKYIIYIGEKTLKLIIFVVAIALICVSAHDCARHIWTGEDRFRPNEFQHIFGAAWVNPADARIDCAAQNVADVRARVSETISKLRAEYEKRVVAVDKFWRSYGGSQATALYYGAALKDPALAMEQFRLCCQSLIDAAEKPLDEARTKYRRAQKVAELGGYSVNVN